MKKLLALALAFCAIALALTALTSLAPKDSIRFMETEPDCSTITIGSYPNVKLETALGAFLLPDSALANLKKEDIVPPEGSLARQICDTLGHYPHLKVSTLSDSEINKMIQLAQQDMQRACAILWVEYAIKCEGLLAKLSSTGFITKGDVDFILDLNNTDLMLRVIDGNYRARIADVMREILTSIQQCKGTTLQTRLQQLQERRKMALFQIGMSKIQENSQRNQAMMNWAIGGLNQIRANSRQRRENFWNYREQKLKTQTPTQYQGVSSICAYCGGLVTIGGNCPCSQDGRHHVSSSTGPKMIDPSNEGLRAW